MSQAQASSSDTKFNLILEGFGYLNRVRLVQPKKGRPYLACSINAMMGDTAAEANTAGALEYLPLDCIVVGSVAAEAIRQLADVVNAKEQKVIVGFRVGDPKIDLYEYPDRKTGEILKGQGLKVRLLQLKWAKVGKTRVEIPVVERPQGSSRDEGDGTAAPASTEHRDHDEPAMAH